MVGVAERGADAMVEPRPEPAAGAPLLTCTISWLLLFSMFYLGG